MALRTFVTWSYGEPSGFRATTSLFSSLRAASRFLLASWPL